MRVVHLKPGSSVNERMSSVSLKQLLSPLLFLYNVINNHLVPNYASLFGHFDNRISVPYRIRSLLEIKSFDI